MSKKDKLPPAPRFEPFQQGSDKAVSESITKLQSDKIPEVFLNANLTHRERKANNLMRNIGDDFHLNFLLNYVIGDCIFSVAEDGKRSDQTVEIVRQPQIQVEGGTGFFGSIKDRLRV